MSRSRQWIVREFARRSPACRGTLGRLGVLPEEAVGTSDGTGDRKGAAATMAEKRKKAQVPIDTEGVGGGGSGLGGLLYNGSCVMLHVALL